jgi:hypothetical protein
LISLKKRQREIECLSCAKFEEKNFRMASKLEKLKTKQQEVKLPGSRKQKTRVEGSVLQVEHK